MNCGNFPKTIQATRTELYITTRKNAFGTAEVLKTFEIQQYIGFFEVEGLLELFTANVRRSVSDPQTIRETGINFKSKEIWRDN